MAVLKRLSAWVDQEVKEAFIRAAKAQGNTESGLLGLLVGTFLNRNPALIEQSVEDDGETKSDRVTVRFTKAEGRILLKLSSARGLKRSAYLSGLFRAQATGEPYFTDDEIGSLRDANRQLAAVGRNVNQIAKALNTSLDQTDMAKAVEYEQMKALIEAHRQEVKALIRANLKSWGVADGD
jgi:Bacterial mobilisation protein (MobC)